MKHVENQAYCPVGILDMPMRKIVDSGGYKRAGSEYFVVLLHVIMYCVTIKSDED